MAEHPKQLCFVDMPFGEKKDPATGTMIDFNQIYEQGIKPGVLKAGLSCIRGAHETTGGIIHTAMFARLLLSEFVIADLTSANPNVFYELGIRHAAKPYTTIPIFATSGAIPFDVGFIRAIPYELEDGKLTDASATALNEAICHRIRCALEGPTTKDSPLFDLFDSYPGIEMSHQLTDVFRDRVQYNEKIKQQLAAIRNAEESIESRQQALYDKQQALGDLKAIERGILVDLMLSYRAVNGWQYIIDLYQHLPSDCQESSIVQQQYAMALNRTDEKNNKKQAIKVLENLMENKGESAETWGLLGRIHKDFYHTALANKPHKAPGHLENAIKAYTRGFECEPSDYYPGINAITLLLQQATPEAKLEADRLAPLVAFAVARQGGAESNDYWTLATVLELAAIQEDLTMIKKVLAKLLVLANEAFQPKTTADNLQLILNLTTSEPAKEVLAETISALLLCEQELKDGDN